MSSATLSNLVFDATVTSLAPSFQSAVLAYTATNTAAIPYAVTLTPTSAGSTITVNGNTVSSGSPITLTFSIMGSINTITIVSVNSGVTCTYIITFPNLSSKSTTVLSAFNTSVSTNTQRFQMNLDNSTSTAPIVQYIQDLSLNSDGYTSKNVAQRFVFGSCLINTPLELTSTLNAAGTAINSDVKASRFLTYSDVRLKQNVKILSDMQGVDDIKVVQYNNISDNSIHFGVLAHELAETYPELVHHEEGDSENLQYVSYTELIPICINVIQQLKKKQVMMQTRLDALKITLL